MYARMQSVFMKLAHTQTHTALAHIQTLAHTQRHDARLSSYHQVKSDKMETFTVAGGKKYIYPGSLTETAQTAFPARMQTFVLLCLLYTVR